MPELRECLFRLNIIHEGREVTTSYEQGTFHQWGSNFIEFENGAMQVTTAIVEDAQGKIHEVVPSNVKFKR